MAWQTSRALQRKLPLAKDRDHRAPRAEPQQLQAPVLVQVQALALAQAQEYILVEPEALVEAPLARVASIAEETAEEARTEAPLADHRNNRACKLLETPVPLSSAGEL